jgi:hypothetical protein
MEWARTDPRLRMLPGLGIAYALHYPAGAFRAASNRAHIMDYAATITARADANPGDLCQRNRAGIL